GRSAVRDVVASITELQSTAPLLRRLRDYLAAHVQNASVHGAVRALAVSERSLQRHLSSHATSFRHELMRARVEAAQILLSESDAKLDAVALRVGCSSGSNLGTLFRRITGVTPAQYRAVAEKQRRLAKGKR